MRDPPTGTVTFLFTDIEGSTRLWEGRPDEMRAALVEHDALVRDAIDAHGGYVFSTGGDGFAAAFSRAHDAVDAARKAQAALADRLLLKVRMGIHTGEVQERDGDYFGPAVNRAARIMAAGHGGQVLVAQASAELLGRDVELNDLGSHRLRDIDRDEQVFQIAGRQFPSLRVTSDSARSNLPTLRSSFIGREGDVAALCALVDRWRLITITGPGGVGKTRTAIQVSHELRGRFSDGVWWVELGSVTAADQVDGAVASTLRVQRREGLSFTDSLVDHLRRQRALLVIDNCEHLLEAAARLIDTLTRSSERIVVIATSRESLDLDGEHGYPLGALELPASGTVADVERASATALFVDRARVVDPSFAVDRENAASIANVCRRLDAIPLAIELAAAKSVAFAPAQIEQLLEQRFRLLTRAGREGPRRQQTLEATIAWSYDLLAPDEAALLDRLSVFAGSFDLAAAQTVAGDHPLDAFGVAEILASLVRKSLVVARPGHRERRFALLETVRAFAERRLVEVGEWERYRDRHLDYWAVFAERAGAGFVSLEEPEWTERIINDLDDLRHAFRWAADHHRLDAALGITAAIGRVGWMNPNTDIHSWCEEALRLDGGLDHERAGEVAQWVAATLSLIGDLERARQWAVFATARESAKPLPFAWMVVASMAAATGEVAEGIAGAQAMIDAASREQPVDAVAVAIAANIFAICNEIDQALTAARLAIVLTAERPTMSSRVYAHMALAYALMNSDPAAALRAADESLDAIGDSADFPPVVWTLIARVVAHLRLGLVADACADLVTALPAAVRGGTRWAVFQHACFLVPVLRHAGEEHSAWAIYLAVREVVHPAAVWDLVEPPAEQSPPASELPVLRDYDQLVQFVLEALAVAADRLHVS